jgi:hypothetical protein
VRALGWGWVGRVAAQPRWGGERARRDRQRTEKVASSSLPGHGGGGAPRCSDERLPCPESWNHCALSRRLIGSRAARALVTPTPPIALTFHACCVHGNLGGREGGGGCRRCCLVVPRQASCCRAAVLLGWWRHHGLVSPRRSAVGAESLRWGEERQVTQRGSMLAPTAVHARTDCGARSRRLRVHTTSVGNQCDVSNRCDCVPVGSPNGDRHSDPRWSSFAESGRRTFARRANPQPGGDAHCVGASIGLARCASLHMHGHGVRCWLAVCTSRLPRAHRSALPTRCQFVHAGRRAVLQKFWAARGGISVRAHRAGRRA